MLAALLVAMLIAGLNYNSNLALAFAFLMASMALVAMHHCHRNLLGLSVDVATGGGCLCRRATPRSTSCCATIRASTAATSRFAATPGPPAWAACAATATSESCGRACRSPRRGMTPLRVNSNCAPRYPFGWFHAWTYVQGPLTAYRRPSPARQPHSAVGRSGSRRRRALRGARRRGLRGPARLRARHTAEAHGLEGAGARRRGRRYAAIQQSGRAARMARLVLARRAGRRGTPVAAVPLGARERGGTSRPTACGCPGTEIAPGRGAAHRSPVCGRCAALAASSLESSIAEPRVTYEQLLGICACLALALLAHVGSLPLWILGASWRASRR